jgi:hypothetical protein
MANPYAFGQKDYTALDRRRQMIDEAMKNNFETSNAIAGMQKQKEIENQTDQYLQSYSSIMKDKNATTEDKFNKASEVMSNLSRINPKAASNVNENFQIWASMERGQRQPQRKLNYVPMLDEKGKPITKLFGNDIKYKSQAVDETTGEKVFDAQGNPIWKYESGGNLPADSGGGGGTDKKKLILNELDRKKEALQTDVFNTFGRKDIDLAGMVRGTTPIPQVPAVDKNGKPIYAKDGATQESMPHPKVIAYLKAMKEYETEALNQGVPIKRAGLQSNLPAEEPAPVVKTSAPQSAIDFLKNNNTLEMQKAFKSKYGYLP